MRAGGRVLDSVKLIAAGALRALRLDDGAVLAQRVLERRDRSRVLGPAGEVLLAAQRHAHGLRAVGIRDRRKHGLRGQDRAARVGRAALAPAVGVVLLGHGVADAGT